MKRKAIIIGAGPAGLTAAWELLKRTDITPVVIETSNRIGGLSKTINYKGNRMDIGGHRFFSKSDRVMNWWLHIMPLQQTDQETITINYQNRSHHFININAGHEEKPGQAMLLRKRFSRIYFLRKFFDYPVQISFDTLYKLGVFTTARIFLSYIWASIFPRTEKNLEDFLINRFGKTLYQLFFKDYTEKVWGVACSRIPAAWGAQRIKGVSVSKAIAHAAAKLVKKGKHQQDIAQKNTETSLIEQFLYPPLGPGQLWEEVAKQIVHMGGEIRLNEQVHEIETGNKRIKCIKTVNAITNDTSIYEGDYFFSTMPVKDLIAGMGNEVTANAKEAAAGLQYRDFIMVGILLKKLGTIDRKTGKEKAFDLKDTWIYTQDRDVKAGRLQIFNNWSPYMVHNPGTVWIGLEYFCTKGDMLWRMSDEAIQQMAIGELEKMELIQAQDVLDSTVHREEKTYPAYFGTYERFDDIKDFVDSFGNLFLVGRNGMHKYNNTDHSMLTAMVAVDNIVAGVTSKANIWAINTEQEYHEEKQAVFTPAPAPQATPSFAHFLFKNKTNKWALCIAGILAVLQFTAFKWLYPFASFMPDSKSYIEAAMNHYAINFWPVGYSRFLYIFKAIVQNDTALVLFQYLFVQAGALFFAFTFFYFLKPSPVVRYLLLAFFVVNPLFLIAGNYVSADALFLAISFIWAAQLLWLLYKPNPYILPLHALVLFLAFTVRFNALYYPVISAIVIGISKLRWPTRLAGAMLSFLLIGVFIWNNSNQYKALTGKRQFAAFSGWQLAGNALYAYSRVPENNEPVPEKFQALHRIVNHHIDSLNKLAVRPDSTPGIYYLWKGPLTQYLGYRYRDTTITDFKHFASMAPLYKEYGMYLIKKYPGAYAKYFLWPNLVNYYAPPAEFLGQYNIYYNELPQVARNWFDYRTTTVTGYSKEFTLANYMPILSAIFNLLFVGGLVGFLMTGGFKKAAQLSPALILILALWLVNMGFSVLASPIVLRYQLFTMSLIFCAGVVAAEFVYKSDALEKGVPYTPEPAWPQNAPAL